VIITFLVSSRSNGFFGFTELPSNFNLTPTSFQSNLIVHRETFSAKVKKAAISVVVIKFQKENFFASPLFLFLLLLQPFALTPTALSGYSQNLAQTSCNH
jgi:hypothetical protein